MRESVEGRQAGPSGDRRWFYSDRFDLVVWSTGDGGLTAFHLCYDKDRNEHALTWSERSGFLHYAVDDGDRFGDSLAHKASPVFVANGVVGIGRLIAEFTKEAQAVDQPVRDFVLAKLRSFEAEGAA